MKVETDKCCFVCDITGHFGIGAVQSVEELQSGHINQTFLVSAQSGDYILQSLNEMVFRHPEAVMHNIGAVAAAFRTALEEANQDILEATLEAANQAAKEAVNEAANQVTLGAALEAADQVAFGTTVQAAYFERQMKLPCKLRSKVSLPEYVWVGSQNFLILDGKIWRVYRYVPGRPAEAGDGYDTGFAFGSFIRVFHSADICLEPSLQGYHDFDRYYDGFFSAIERAQDFHAASVGIEMAVLENEFQQRMKKLQIKLKKVFHPSFPKRIIHGDAKTDNIILGADYVSVFDGKYDGHHACGKSCTILDLDTVMEYYVALDFGDMVRSITSDATQERRLDIVLERIRDITAGFADGLDGLLTGEEIASLYDGILWVTGELAIRYLTDCYAEEKYFRDKTTTQCMERVRQLLYQYDIFCEMQGEIEDIIQIEFQAGKDERYS